MSRTSSETRADSRVRPLKALGAARKLMADPNDTQQVFVILKALRGRAYGRIFRQFAATPTGAKVLRDQHRLLDVLQDHATLETLGPSTLGGTYLAFMRAEDLSADGLVLPSALVEDNDDITPGMRLVRDRLRDAHDLNHTVTGYGREPLGELCLLAFMFGQTRNAGLLFIVMAGLKKHGFGKQAPAVWLAIWEAWRRGRKARWLPGTDWEAELASPLASVREMLEVGIAPRYEALKPA